jgi:hypothetical protein
MPALAPAAIGDSLLNVVTGIGTAKEADCRMHLQLRRQSFQKVAALQRVDRRGGRLHGGIFGVTEAERHGHRDPGEAHDDGAMPTATSRGGGRMVLTTISAPGSGSSRTAIPPVNGTLSTRGLSSMRPLSARARITALAMTRMTLSSLTASCVCDRCTSLTKACREIRQRTMLARFSVPAPSWPASAYFQRRQKAAYADRAQARILHALDCVD